MNIKRPFNVEDEERVIASVIRDPFVIPQVCNILTPEMFYDLKMKLVYLAVLEADRKSLVISCPLIARMCRDIDPKITVEESDLIRLWIGGSGYDFNYHIGRMFETHKRRLIIDSCLAIAEKASEGEVSTDVLFDDIENKRFEIDSRKDEMEVCSIDDLCNDFDGMSLEDWLEDRWEKSKKGLILDGPSTGFPTLDECIGGLAPSRMVTIAAGTGVGKTEVMCQLVKNLCEAGENVLFFSLEMSKNQLSKRMLGIKSNIFHGQYSQMRMSREEMERSKQAVKEMRRSWPGLKTVHKSNLTAVTIGKWVKRYKKTFGISVVVIDHLLLVQPSTQMLGTQFWEQVQYNSRQMKIHASENNVCMLVATQLGRDAAKEQDKKVDSRRPGMYDIKGSSGIEQDSDQVIILHPKGQDTSGNSYVDWIVAKNRHNETRTIPFMMHRSTQTLTEAPRQAAASLVNEKEWEITV